MNAQKYLGWLTAIVVLGYLAASAYAMFKSTIGWADFSGAIGPIAGTLLGYWVRGAQQ